MAKQSVTVIFEDPNKAEEFELLFRKILVEKLMEQKQAGTVSKQGTQP